MENLETLLTVREVMDVLRVARQQPYRWHQSGVLRALVLPTGSLRWRKADVAAFINGTYVAPKEGGAL